MHCSKLPDTERLIGGIQINHSTDGAHNSRCSVSFHSTKSLQMFSITLAFIAC